MNFDMTFNDWCLLWKRLFLTVWGIIFGLAIILTRGSIKFVLRAYKCLLCWIGTHPKGCTLRLSDMPRAYLDVGFGSRRSEATAGVSNGRFNLPHLRFTPKRRPL